MYGNKLHPMQSSLQMTIEDLVRFEAKFNLLKNHRQLRSIIDMAQFKVRLALNTRSKLIKWMDIFMYLSVDLHNQICISVGNDWSINVNHPELTGHKIYALNDQLRDIHTQYVSSHTFNAINCSCTQYMKLHIVGGSRHVSDCMFVTDTPAQVLNKLSDWLDDSICRGSFVGMC